MVLVSCSSLWALVPPRPSLGGQLYRDQNESRGNKQNISSLMSLTETSFQPNDAPNNHSNQGLGGQIVLSAHNLCPERFNCDKLFNLLSLYGNVDKVSNQKH